MSFLIDLINSINKFLGYLNISTKYLNRAYTLLSIVPTLFIFRVIVGLWNNGNYLQFGLYTLLLIVLIYFTILNFFYYFLNKNSKFDVTQLFVKYLPEDAFGPPVSPTKTTQHPSNSFDSIQYQKVPIQFVEDYELILAEHITYLMDENVIPTNDITSQDGYLLDKYTLYPYYHLKQKDPYIYEVSIGKNFTELTKIGKVVLSPDLSDMKPVGLLITGGDFVQDGLRFSEPYHVTLMMKLPEQEVNHSDVTRRSRRNKKK